jgi:SAM-dependent methyltransferase
VTPIFDEGHVNRHAQRYRYFFEPLLAALGGSLSNRTVLDLGCNAGYWSLASLHAGCDFVCAIDGRLMHVLQAELVMAAERIGGRRYRLIHADVLQMDFTPLGRFNIVLCLGLLYHVNQPMQLLERAVSACTDILVIDTSVFPSADPVLAIEHDDLSDPRSALGSDLVFFPSVPALVSMVRALGMRGVVLRPSFSDYSGSEDYRDGKRRAVLCSRHHDLSSLEPLAEQIF